ncbi:MAG: ribbon-helix-helix protein, CopG family [Planctomycetota bacterium]|jgi:hypothetical protein
MANHKRPEDRHSTNVTIRFKTTQLERIDKEAAAQNTTRSNIVRDMVDEKTFPHEIDD